MIKKTITTLYGNLAPVHERYVNKAIFNKQDLEVKYKGDKMIVAFNQLDNPVKTTIVADKFTGQPAKLYYYNWKPFDKRQGVLLV